MALSDPCHRVPPVDEPVGTDRDGDTAVVRGAARLRGIRATPVVVLSRCNTG